MGTSELGRPGVELRNSSELTFEDRLLLACVRAQVHPAHAGAIERPLDHQVDWDYLLQSGRRHAVLPLVERNLRAVFGEGVPEEVQRRLRHTVQQTQQLNMARVGELLRLLERFARRGIRVLPWKGPLLALQAYGDVGLRQFADLDLLIHKRDFPAALQLLLEERYLPHTPLEGAAAIAAYPYQGPHEYRLERDGLLVELQWQALQRPFSFPPDADRWWDELELVTIAGRRVLAMPLESLVLILCVHGSKHLWDRLVWLCDVAALIARHPDLDWQRLYAQARDLVAERMLNLGLLMVRELLGAEVPPFMLEKMRDDRQMQRLAALSWEMLFRKTEAMPPEVSARMPLYRFWMVSRFRDKVRIAAQHAPSLLNPVRIVKLYGIKPLKHLLGI